MQFNKNKSSPSILSIVNVVFTRKNQNFWKKAPTILLIKARPEVWTIIGRRAAEQDGVARRRQLTGLFVDAPRLHGSTAPRLQSVPWAQSPQLSQPACQLPHASAATSHLWRQYLQWRQSLQYFIDNEADRERWRYNIFTISCQLNRAMSLQVDHI